MIMENKYRLLQYLIDCDSPVSSKEAQEILKVSRKSITNYINSINDEFNNLVVSSSKGYVVIDKKQAREKLALIHSEYYEPNVRRKEMIYNIILSKDGIMINDIIGKYYISEATLKIDLLKIKRALEKNDLLLKTKKDRIYIIGKEENKRKYIYHLIEEDIENNSIGIEYIQEFFSIVNLETIKTIILNSLNINDSFVDDFTLLNYVLHISILIETKIKSNNRTFNNDSAKSISFDDRLIRIVKEILSKLNEKYKANISLEEMLSISALLSTRLISKDVEKISYEKIKSNIPNEVSELLETILLNMHNLYYIDLRNDTFKVRFAYHLLNLITRLKNNIILPENPFINIKEEHRYLWFVAEYICSLINEEFHVKCSFAEVNYIALHLGMSIEEKKNSDKKIYCAIVVYDYYNSGRVLFEKISGRINNLYLYEISNSFTNINEDKIDLIISTMDIPNTITIPSVKVGYIFSEDMIKKIQDKIKYILLENDKKILECNIKNMMSQDLFFADGKFKDKTEVFNRICNTLLNKGLISKKFKYYLNKREEMATTAFDGVAIPHAINIDEEIVFKSQIAVIISNSPIIWGDDNVNFVFLIALKKDDRKLFKYIFDALINVLNDKNAKTRLLQCKNFEDFVKELIKGASCL